MARVEIGEVEPGILVDPDTVVVGVGRQDLGEAVTGRFRVDGELVITGCVALAAREKPNLEEADFGVARLVVLAVLNTRAGAHHLHVARANHVAIAHAVFVAQAAAQGNTDDFHVVVRVHPEAPAARHHVVVEYPQRAEVHPLGILVIGETEGMVRIEPAVVGVAPGSGAVKHAFSRAHFLVGQVVETERRAQLIVGGRGRFGHGGRSGGGGQAQQAVLEKFLAIHAD